MKMRDLNSRRSSLHDALMTGVMNWRATVLVLGSGLVAGCITVNAPDEPIVIELNINIKQEVIYRLAADAGTTIDENEEIF